MISIILAGGKSSRFDNKSKSTYSLKCLNFQTSLLELNIINLMKQSSKIVIICNEDNYNDVLEIVDKYNYRFYVHIQGNEGYGPAYPLKEINDLQIIDSKHENIGIFFGDNLIWGSIYNFPPLLTDALVTFKILEYNEDNLRFSYINNDNVIIEKPHNFKEGKFFCGYCIVSPSGFEKITNIKLSSRGEYEITDFLNLIEKKQFVSLDALWSEITYQQDIKPLIKKINENIQSI